MVDIETMENTEEKEPLKIKLTDWAKEPTVADFKQDWEDADEDRNNHIHDVDIWLDYLHVQGTKKRKHIPGRSGVTPKLIRKQAEWRYASLSEPFLSTKDMFTIAPETYEDKEAAKQNSLIINNQFNTKLKKNKFIDEYVRTAVDEGSVLIYVGWQVEEEIVVKDSFEFTPTQDPKILQELNNIAQNLQNDPQYLNTLNPEVVEAFELSQANNIAYQVNKVGTREELVETINQPDLEILNYNNYTIDPTAMGEITKANFVIRNFESSLSELQKSSIDYKNLDQIDVEGASTLNDVDYETREGENFSFKDKPRKRLVIYEYWGFMDIDGSGALTAIVAAYVGDVLIRLEENPFPDKKLPFVLVQYLPVRGKMYGEPDGELLKDNQDIIGATTRGLIDSMARIAVGQQGYRQDALDVTNKRKYDAGKDYMFNAAVDPRQAFYTHTYPAIPDSAQIMINVQNAEAESLTGVRAFAQSTVGNIGAETAAGVRGATDAASKREMGILRRLSTGIEEIGRKIIMMNAKWLSETEVVRITNDKFVTIRRDDLAGNFDLRLSISTPESDTAKAEQLAFMLQTTGQTIGAAMSQLILSEIADLRKMPVLAKQIREFKPAPDPLAEEKAKLEIQLLKEKIYNENAKGNENNANANLDNAKAKREISTADKLDLDFAEQEAGVTQERDKEKLSVQSEGNKQLENQKHVNKIIQNELAT